MRASDIKKDITIQTVPLADESAIEGGVANDLLVTAATAKHSVETFSTKIIASEDNPTGGEDGNVWMKY